MNNLLLTSVKLDVVRLKLDKLMMQVDNDNPTLNQYANRLIEFIEEEYITEAYNEFIELVAVGFKPELAFRLVTGQ